MHPGRPHRPAGRASAARPPAAGHRLPWLPPQQGAARGRRGEGLRGPVPGLGPGFGGGKVFEPACQDADHVGEGRHAVLKDVTRSSRAAIGDSWYRWPICLVTGPPPSVRDDITRLSQMSTAGPGRAGPNGLPLPPKLTAGDAKPLPAHSGAAACSPPGAHAADGWFSTAWGRAWGLLAPSARDLKCDSVVCDAGYAPGYGLPIGGVTATHIAQGGVVSPVDVGSDISCRGAAAP